MGPERFQTFKKRSFRGGVSSRKRFENCWDKVLKKKLKFGSVITQELEDWDNLLFVSRTVMCSAVSFNQHIILGMGSGTPQ